MAIQSRLPAFLLTRPRAQSLRFAGQLRQALGEVSATISPVIEAEWLRPILPEGTFRGVIFTSETAVAASAIVKAAGLTLPTTAWCVGDRTAAAARELGFDARSADGDAGALVAMICAQPTPGPLLHLHGEETRGDVAGHLCRAGVPTEGVVVYRQQAKPLTPEACALLGGRGGVAMPLFSPRSAALLLAQLQTVPLRATPVFFALSPAVDAELGEAAPGPCFVAARPDVSALIACIAQRFAADGTS